MMIKDRTACILCAIASVLLLLALVMGCVYLFAFNGDFYKTEYAKLGTASYVEVSENSLFNATDGLLDYLEDRSDSLDVKTDDGEAFFNERETLHMVDVKNLYQTASTVAWIFTAVGAGLVVLCIAAKKKRAFLPLAKGFFYAGAGVGIFFVFLAVYAAADFNTFWINFHLTFFTNDLWMLNPATDRMIRMYETAFFSDMVLSILVLFLSVYAGLMVFTGIVVSKSRKKVR